MREQFIRIPYLNIEYPKFIEIYIITIMQLLH